jgi:hypothetical protein
MNPSLLLWSMTKRKCVPPVGIYCSTIRLGITSQSHLTIADIAMECGSTKTSGTSSSGTICMIRCITCLGRRGNVRCGWKNDGTRARQFLPRNLEKPTIENSGASKHGLTNTHSEHRCWPISMIPIPINHITSNGREGQRGRRRTTRCKRRRSAAHIPGQFPSSRAVFIDRSGCAWRHA